MRVVQRPATVGSDRGLWKLPSSPTVTKNTINVKLSHLRPMMNDLADPGASSDLAERIAALNAVVTQLSEEAARLREEAQRLQTEHARIRAGGRTPLWFLLQLQYEEFPLGVIGPKEVQCVSVLTATGLIEAEMAPLNAAARYAALPVVATVTRITEHGHAEIARIEDMPDRAPASMPSARELRAV